MMVEKSDYVTLKEGGDLKILYTVAGYRLRRKLADI